MPSTIPFVESVRLRDDADLDSATHPGGLGFVKDLDFRFESPVTFFVGENGSGKSTLIEAMAVLARLPIWGGGTHDLAATPAVNEKSLLAEAMRMVFIRQPRDRYFFRAETQSHFASLLESRAADPEFKSNPYRAYGGKSLHKMSHGEAFLSVMNHRFSDGLFFMDEPESALSPQRQLSLLRMIHAMASSGKSQFFIATHSPIILTFPGAQIVSFDHGRLEAVTVEETSHFQLTRDLLNNPEMYWRHLTRATNDDL